MSAGDFDDPGQSGGGGWTIRVMLDCYKCRRQDEAPVVYAEWLEPVLVRQGDAWLQTQLCAACARFNPRYWIRVRWKLRIGRIGDFFAPGYGACGRCRTNWHFAKSHNTYVDGAGGMFPLCQQCWAELTPEERLPYYRALFDSWSDPRPYTWAQLERAVLSEQPR